METEDRDFRIERMDTAIRIAYTLLFFLVNRLLGMLLALIVFFELAYTLITTLPPSERIRAFANQLVAYTYRVQRYLTHNEPELPFPFSDFPKTLEPTGWPYAHEQAELDPLRGM